MDQAFTILEDWAHGQLFDSTALNVERDVVLEEWRGRKGADDRILQKWLPVAFQGSLYAQRLPIGTEQSIESATRRVASDHSTTSGTDPILKWP